MHRLRNEETKQIAIEITQVNGVLLMKKNEIRTDRKHPLTTPEDASVLRALCPFSRVFFWPPKGPEEAEILF